MRVAFEEVGPERRKAVRALRAVLAGDAGALARVRAATSEGRAMNGGPRAE